MDFKFFVGIDVAKLTIDVALFTKGDKNYLHQAFPNDKKGFAELFKWIRQVNTESTRHLVVCLEHTGIYSLPLCIFLQHKGFPIVYNQLFRLNDLWELKEGKMTE